MLLPVSKISFWASLGVLAGLAVAQVGTSSVTGRVVDPTGAVVPNAQLIVVQTETNFKFTATTNNEGIYRIQSLQPGTYEMTVAASGFKSLIRQNIVLRTGDVLGIDLELEVGATTESIRVSAQSGLLETETSSTGTVTEGNTLFTLPIFQRFVMNAMNLVPGVTMSGYAYGGSMGGYNIAGQRFTGTAVFEDGVLGMNPQTNSGTPMIKPVENSVEETKTLTGTLPAEYGHTTGGVVSVVKKSGTNELHGMADEFGRTLTMTQRRFFDQYRTTDPQPGFPNGVIGFYLEPDANVGGPIVIPKVYNGRNKTFFFFGYHKLVEKKTNGATGQTPTPDELAGDFTLGGLGNPLYDPQSTRQLPNGSWARDPFPNNRIPLNRFDPVAAKIIQINPWQPPNQPGSFSSTGPVSNFAYGSRSRTYIEDFNGRVDHQFSSSLKMYGSYTYNHINGTNRPENIRLPIFDANNGIVTPFTQQNASIGFTYLFSPTIFNDARVGYYRSRNDTFVPSYGQNWPAMLGIPNDNLSLMPAFAALGSDQLSVNSIYGLTQNGPSHSIPETLSFRDDLSKIVGVHSFKAGYEVLQFRGNSWLVGQPSGVFQFDTMTAGLQASGQPVPNTGNTFAGFELGSVRQATFSQYTTTWLPRDSVNGLYLQDDWKFSPKLTFNLGVRWSTESPYNTKTGLKSQFDPTAIDPLTGLTGAIVHPAGSLNQRDWKNFQPRIGLAWHPLNKWVFRSGFALYTVDIRFPNALEQFDEYQAQNNQQQPPGNPLPLFQLSHGPAPITYNVLSNGSAPYVGTNYGSRNAAWLDPNLHPAYVLNWNTTVEYQVGANNLLKISYQGSSGVDLVESWNTNAFPTNLGANNPALQSAAFAAPQNYLPYPQFGAINHLSNTGHSTYHSGTVEFQKRYSQGLVLDTFYTFSKVLDDCDSDGGVCTGVAPVTDRNLNKGRAGYDRSQVARASVIYEFPVGKGRHFLNRGGLSDTILGGWEIAIIQDVDTGNPLSFSYVNCPNNYFPTSIGNWVPNLIQRPPNLGFEVGFDYGPNRFNQALINGVISPNNFGCPAAFTQGNAGRNIVTGRGLLWTASSFKKNFHIKERFVVQIRCDWQNPFHHFAMNPPSTQFDFKNQNLFGKYTADQLTSTIGGQPIINLQLRVSW